MRPLIFVCSFCLLARTIFAGDAVAVGYAYDGAWAAVTYNRSSTPKGGPHYHDATQACTFALRDLRSRGNEYLWRSEILGQSDKTGYVAVARGKAIVRNKDVTAVGRGKSQSEADQNALKKLSDREAATEAEIVYRYFSYGTDSGARLGAKHKKLKEQAAGSRSAARKA